MAEILFLVFHRIGGCVVPFLLREALYASILFGVVATVSRLIRFRSPRFRTGLWMLVFIRLILPTDWSHPFSGRSLISRLIPPLKTESFGGSIPAGPETRVPAVYGTEDVPVPETATADSVLFFFWISGLIIFSALYSKQISRYRRILSRAVPLETEEALSCLETWRAHFGIRRPVRLMTGHGDVSPFTLGVIRPVILIPESVMQSVRRSELECVIAHELAHVKRRDALWITLQNFLQIGYFFHPLVWMAGSRLGLARECA
ncbi:MAG TPA: M56 family metallopeptidase [bacterium]|nr:M56 family metallopeptidase [bacterium]